MNPNDLKNLSTLAKVAAATFCGALFGALTLTAVPTTLDGWKMLMAPALGAAIAAELTFLKQQIAAYLATSPLSGFTTTTTETAAPPPAQKPTSKIPPAIGMVMLAIGISLATPGIAACGPTPAPQTIVADVVTAEQAACIILNATVSVPLILQICNLAQALTPVVQQIVDSELAARAKYNCTGAKHASASTMICEPQGGCYSINDGDDLSFVHASHAWQVSGPGLGGSSFAQ